MLHTFMALFHTFHFRFPHLTQNCVVLRPKINHVPSATLSSVIFPVAVKNYSYTFDRQSGRYLIPYFEGLLEQI